MSGGHIPIYYVKIYIHIFAAAAAKSLQSCLTLCNPIDGSPPGSPVPLQARTLEWVAISFSNVWKWKLKVKTFSRVRLLAIPWTAAYQAPPSMGLSRQEYWSGVPLPSPKREHRAWEMPVFGGFAVSWGLQMFVVIWGMNVVMGEQQADSVVNSGWSVH